MNLIQCSLPFIQYKENLTYIVERKSVSLPTALEYRRFKYEYTVLEFSSPWKVGDDVEQLRINHSLVFVYNNHAIWQMQSPRTSYEK